MCAAVDLPESVEAWFGRRTHHWRDWSPRALLEAKDRHGLSVSLVVPARNEEDTVGDVISSVRRELVEQHPLLDEVVVIDSDSTDRTAAHAARAGAEVHRAADIRPDLGARRGKGEALWKSQFVTRGDVVAFLDADLTRWGPHFVTGVLAPLLLDPDVQLVKGFYDRLLNTGPAQSTQGGRVTELVARPLIATHWPALNGLVQPLAGEWAVRRALLAELPMPVGYAVELSVLVDTYHRYGLDAIAQVDLGVRAHLHQALPDLGAMAVELVALAARRTGRDGGVGHVGRQVALRQFAPGALDGQGTLRLVSVDERPPAGRTAAPPVDHPAVPAPEERR